MYRDCPELVSVGLRIIARKMESSDYLRAMGDPEGITNLQPTTVKEPRLDWESGGTFGAPTEIDLEASENTVAPVEIIW